MFRQFSEMFGKVEIFNKQKARFFSFKIVKNTFFEKFSEILSRYYLWHVINYLLTDFAFHSLDVKMILKPFPPNRHCETEGNFLATVQLPTLTYLWLSFGLPYLNGYFKSSNRRLWDRLYCLCREHYLKAVSNCADFIICLLKYF